VSEGSAVECAPLDDGFANRTSSRAAMTNVELTCRRLLFAARLTCPFGPLAFGRRSFAGGPPEGVKYGKHIQETCDDGVKRSHLEPLIEVQVRGGAIKPPKSGFPPRPTTMF
jgi:hypothetical protein